MPEASNKLAVVMVTGASSGIGLELAKIAAGEGYDLIIAADEDQIDVAADILRSIGVTVDAMRVDLSTTEGARDFARFVADNGPTRRPLACQRGTGARKGVPRSGSR